jgi:UDP-glucuronate decarboxylase
MNEKQILVTGGAGFVGSHLVDALMAMGHSVIVLDNFNTGNAHNLNKWQSNPRFKLIQHDITEPFDIQLDQIYHLACPASPTHYQLNPVTTLKTSLLGTLNMLVLALRTRARILLSSTSEVYGDPQVHPQSESYWGNVNPIGPRACYDEGKRAAETLMYCYERHDNVDVRVVRIFNTYGPRMAPDDGRVVANFIMQALQGHDITIYGDGSQTRSFQYIDDLIDGIIKTMDTNYSKPINLGNPHEITIRDFAELVKLKTGSNSRIVHLDLPEDDPHKRMPDISLAKSVLDWEPHVDLDQGLDRTIEYFKQVITQQ